MRRWWLLAFVAFFLMGTAWALALPVNGTYDEKDHIVRAYAVASGHLTTSRTAVNAQGDREPAVAVPATLLPDGNTVDCTWYPPPPKPASCQRWSHGPGTVLTPTGAAKYSPVYYLPVGVPLVFAPNLTGVVLARLVSALLSALLLASAVVAALRLGSRLMVLGTAVTATPLAMNLDGSLNPNGLEIAAGVLVFCSLLALLRGEGDERRLLALAGTGSALLLTVRHFGAPLLGLAVVACGLLARPGRTGELWRRRDTRWILGGCWAGGAAFAVAWLGYSRLGDIASNTRRAVHLTAAEELHRIATWRVPFYVTQVVGQFGYGETTISPYAIWLWYLLVVALVVPCLVLAGWRARWVLAGLAMACLGLLLAMEVYFVPRIGWFSHGRYAMPAAVGVVLGAAAVGRFEEWLTQRGWLGRYTLALAVATAPVHLYALARVMTRFESGIAAPLEPFGGSWRPPAGPVLPLLTNLAGLGVLVWIATRHDTRRPTTVGRSSLLHP